MDEKIKRLREWFFHRKQGPTQIQAHFTNFCNLKCFFCPTRSLLKKSEIKKNEELTKEEWFRLISESKKLGVKEWHICGGGEPLFDIGLAKDVMLEIKNKGLQGEIITNGTLFKEDFIKALINSDWNKITFSIDGPDAEVHDNIRGVACFEKTIKNIKLFSHYKSKFIKDRPRLSLHVVVCNKNYDKLDKIIKMAKEIGVQDVLFNAMNIWSDDIKQLELSDEQKKELNENLHNLGMLAKDLGVGTNVGEFMSLDMFNKANKLVDAMEENFEEEKGLANTACYMPWYNISIFADGRVQPCFILQDKGESCKEKNLGAIWNSDYFNNVRQAMINNQLNDVCSLCNPWSFSKNKEIKSQLRDIVS